MKYCIWNNKGGVGKSFLTFCIATEYAIQNPNELVVVADMCPQANVSEMLLGGNGKGQENQTVLFNDGRTIAEYIKERYSNSKHQKLGTELKYVVPLNEFNDKIPENMFLLSGDVDLDISSSLVLEMYNSKLKEAPNRAMSLLRDVLQSFEQAHNNKKTTFFIDCNPSFSIYTELAIFASERLIIPCTGDFSSFRGANNVMKILYGINEKEIKESDFELERFCEKAEKLKLNLPVPHLGIINKSRTFDSKATVAYNAHVKKIELYFSGLQNVKNNVGENIFKTIPVINIKDCNNIALVVNYLGAPISKLEHKKYEVYGESTQVNESQLKPMRDDICNLLKYLS